eukprot:TRINITY_DN11485_c0_g1_i4.p3 TRINITY_DN11485_c0_g1~~TRINITY_DN11485_c0_g1_i4.p3  ORF type:complete len:213 (+),score=-5.87 TRINITY_DN11485_c0_g1_i4:477-1115(+)
MSNKISPTHSYQTTKKNIINTTVPKQLHKRQSQCTSTKEQTKQEQFHSFSNTKMRLKKQYSKRVSIILSTNFPQQQKKNPVNYQNCIWKYENSCIYICMHVCKGSNSTFFWVKHKNSRISKSNQLTLIYANEQGLLLNVYCNNDQQFKIFTRSFYNHFNYKLKLLRKYFFQWNDQQFNKRGNRIKTASIEFTKLAHPHHPVDIGTKNAHEKQ